MEMNHKERIKLAWKLVHLVNKECCNDRLVINKIVFFRYAKMHPKGEPASGWYNHRDKSIHIKFNPSQPRTTRKIFLILTMLHELAHARHLQIGKISNKQKDHGRTWELEARKVWKVFDSHVSLR